MKTYWITDAEALLAMYKFLDAYWERGSREDEGIAALLSSLRVLSDGRCADDAQTEDWLQAVQTVVDNRNAQ